MALEIKIDSHGTLRRVVELSGRLDAQSYVEMDRAVDEALNGLGSGGTLVMDLSGLSYISSAGLRSVFRARKLAKDLSGQALLVNLQPQVRKVFDVVKAVPISEVFSSEAELEAYLDNIQKKALEENDDGF